MAKILINDGIHPTGEKLMREAGLQVDNINIPQEELSSRLNEYDGICVRSATTVRKELIDQSPNLKLIARGGVGMDNIDVAYAQAKGLVVYNTPAASSRSVAELAITHMLNIARGLNKSNRAMPNADGSQFKALKKAFSKGVELEGKTIGIIGFGRIGRELANISLGLGMTVLPVDRIADEITVPVGAKSLGFNVKLKPVSMDEMLAKADFISLHVPSTDKPLLGAEEIAKMKDGVVIINTARGGSVEENALLEAMQSGKVRGAGLDVFVGEPSPRKDILQSDSASLSPHIGASTVEAQEKIGIELAEQIIAFFK